MPNTGISSAARTRQMTSSRAMPLLYVRHEFLNRVRRVLRRRPNRVRPGAHAQPGQTIVFNPTTLNTPLAAAFVPKKRVLFGLH